jgi:hypothetical protein
MASAPEQNGERRSRRHGLLLLAVVFLLGLVCGAAVFATVDRIIDIRQPPRPPEGPDRHLGRLARELDLDEDQKQRMREILGESRLRMHAVMRETREELRQVLRPDQLEKFDELQRRRPFGPRGRRGLRERGGRRDGPPPPGPPVPDDAPPQPGPPPPP